MLERDNEGIFEHETDSVVGGDENQISDCEEESANS